MKRSVSIFSSLFFATLNVVAQDIKFPERSLDTIYANEKKNVAMFFPDPIMQGITGSENFVFTYNREKEQYLGLLKALPGDDSNLLVISSTGSVFSYIVRYTDTLKNLNYFISESSSIGNENTLFAGDSLKPEEKLSATQPEKTITDKTSYYQDFSSYLLRSKQKIRNIKKRKEGIVLTVKNIVFDGEELYFVFNLENDSSIDYELSFLSIAVETRKKGKNKSMQKLVQEPVFKFRFPDLITKGHTAWFVYVVPKFSIAEDKVVVIDLKEENGERDIDLKVKKKFINNPY